MLGCGILLLAMVVSGCGLVGAALPYAGLKLSFACIPEHTPIDTPTGATPVEDIQPGGTVIGFSGKPVLVLQKHSYMERPDTVFLRIHFSGGAAVTVCGMHRVAGVRARDIELGETIATQRVIAIESLCGVSHSYDLLTEDAGYRIHGIPVTSMIEEMNRAAITGKINNSRKR